MIRPLYPEQAAGYLRLLETLYSHIRATPSATMHWIRISTVSCEDHAKKELLALAVQKYDAAFNEIRSETFEYCQSLGNHSAATIEYPKTVKSKSDQLRDIYNFEIRPITKDLLGFDYEIDETRTHTIHMRMAYTTGSGSQESRPFINFWI